MDKIKDERVNWAEYYAFYTDKWSDSYSESQIKAKEYLVHQFFNKDATLDKTKKGEPHIVWKDWDTIMMKKHEINAQ